MTRDGLLQAYERELQFIRRMAQEFAHRYPAQAGGLLLEATKCDDPHVERLIESFALLAARVQQRIDDDFGEVSDALLGVLYPHYLSPVPSMAIVQMEIDPEAAPPGGVHVPRHTMLRAASAEGVACRFRTAYPTTLFPLEVRSVEIVPSSTLGAPVPSEALSAIRIHLRSPEALPLAKLEINSLRFHTPGQGAASPRLYELLVKQPRGLVVQSSSTGSPERSICLPETNVRPVGFERDDGMLEYPTESFVGYRLLQEYFAFPEKFLFVDLEGLGRLELGPEDRDLWLSVLIEDSMADLDLRLASDDLKLGCTPIINLFPRIAEPIRLTHRQAEYPVVPDVRAPKHHEVYSISKVTATRPGSSEKREFLPFYAIRHGHQWDDDPPYWSSARRPTHQYAGTEVTISLTDPAFDADRVATDIVHVETLCTNRDLPSRLQFGRAQGDFVAEGHPEIRTTRCVLNPTPTLPSPVAAGSRWRIVSHLALNYLSLSGNEGPGGLNALREILKLYDFADSAVTRRAVNGLVGLKSRKIIRPVGRGTTAGHARGLRIELELEDAPYEGCALFLFASVLDRFLGLYTSVNSFTETIVSVRGREGVLKAWPPRAGELQLL